MKRLILVHGDKGGTGKSHVAQITAAAFRAAGVPLHLVDGDSKNPGLYRSFSGKPDEVMRFNVRKPQGIDSLIEHFLEVPGDVLVDLPAAGSDMTARLCSAGSGEGTLDIKALFPEIGARLLVLFVIDPSRDALVALDAEIKALSNPVTDWIVVRNHRFDEVPFDRFDKWADGKLEGVPVLDMPRLDPKVIDALINAKVNLTELGDLENASVLMKMRGAAALRIWTEQLRKGKVLDG